MNTFSKENFNHLRVNFKHQEKTLHKTTDTAGKNMCIDQSSPKTCYVTLINMQKYPAGSLKVLEFLGHMDTTRSRLMVLWLEPVCTGGFKLYKA